MKKSEHEGVDSQVLDAVDETRRSLLKRVFVGVPATYILPIIASFSLVGTVKGCHPQPTNLSQPADVQPQATPDDSELADSRDASDETTS